MKALSISNWRVQFAFAFTILTLLIVGAISYRELTLSIESNRWARHTHEVLESIHDLSLDWASISSDSRSFVLTGEDSYFESYRAEAAKALEDAEVIRRLTVDNPKQQARISILKPLTAERIEQAEQITSLRRTQGLTAAVAEMQRKPDEQQAVQFNVVTQELQSEELRLLALRDATTKLRLNLMKAGLIFAALLILLIAMAAGWGAVRESSALGLAEVSLRESDEKYRILVDGVEDYAIFMLDPDGTIISWNAGAERIKGYRAEEIIGRNFSCFFTQEDIKRGSPEDILRLAVATGRYEETCTRVRKDGSRFSAMFTITTSRDIAGNLRGFSEISRDLSKHMQSEVKYRGLLEAAPDAMVVVDRNEKIVLLNVQAEKQFGYRRDELVGQSVTRIIPEGFAERLIADGTRTEAEASSQRIGMGIELTARRKDGSEFPIEIMLSPLESADGVLVTAAIRDISLRKESEAKYRGLLEAAPDAMVVVDQQGEIVLLNLQAERQFGYRRDELVGQKVTSIIPEGFAERLIADETRTAAEAFAQQIGTGIELYGLRKDHTGFPMEIMLSPLESAEGTLITAAIRDISVRKESEARYRGLLEAAPDAMVVVNANGEIVLLNVQAEKRFGYSRDELLGRKVTSIIPEGFAERLIADGTRTAAEAFAQQIGTGIELYGLRKDRTEFPMEIMLSPLESVEGTLVTAAIRDISLRKESEAKYRGLLEAAPDAMVVVNANGEIVLLNVQAEKRFGYSRDELLGRKVTSIIPEGFAERLIADGTRTAAEAFAQQIGTGIELYGLRKDRTEFPMEIMLSPLDSADGVLVTAAIRDISMRKESEAKYRGLLEAAPDAMVVVNANGEIVLLNVQAEKRFGYSRDELLGRKVTSIIPEGFAERLIADGTRTAAEAFAQQIGTGIELYGLRKDRTEFPMEIMLSPLDSADGVLVTAAIRDISLRKESEAKYRGLLEAAPDAMVVVNANGEIVLLNLQAERQFGYRRDELVGQKVTSIIPEGFAERLIADETRTAADASAQQIGTGIELCGLRKNGTEFPMEIMLSPLESTDGILVTVAIRDISVRKKAEADLLQNVKELHRSNEELEQFAYIASHDLQEPLRMVASYTQLIGRRYKGKLDSDADEFIAFAVDGASRMQRLIMDLLTYSRVGTKETIMRDISSDEAMRKALFNLRGAIEESGAQVTCDPLPVVSADETQLVQLFQNLIGNAIKYQNGGSPTVHVSAARNGIAKWSFSVKDNGLGIEPQYFERVFGMFQRLHKREEFTGTGIGLAICKKIVERHGGSISVESQLGQGSTFCFVLKGSEKRL